MIISNSRQHQIKQVSYRNDPKTETSLGIPGGVGD